MHNLVHRESLTADGVSFRSRRVPEDREAEFLASTDNWFRPVLARIGPDGGDLGRRHVPVGDRASRRGFRSTGSSNWNLRAGNDRGRIYRVTPPGQPVTEQLSAARSTHDASTGSATGSSQSLATRYGSANAVVASGRSAAVEPLRQLVAHGPSSGRQDAGAVPAGCACRRWTTIGWPSVIRQAEPAVARHAMVVAEPRLADSPDLVDSVLARVATRRPTAATATGLQSGLLPRRAGGRGTGQSGTRRAGGAGDSSGGHEFADTPETWGRSCTQCDGPARRGPTCRAVS